MKTIYAVWHQAEGVVTTHMFEEPPTEAQLLSLRRELERRHNRPDMEMRVREVLLLGPTELPELNPGPGGATGGGDGVAEVSIFNVSGTGEVR